ncbi:hypothetical protein, variant 1 [Verruconis gallopava]|uniref:C2H2-type domain-containing protein n=2 Tax=Verruconis gallopava TaxID=253628 RepID=A0A0D2AR04_9PEZI|nr:hypothetical protein, variant 1 [Verruconis gallopava]KIW09128.1 hypothetical protein, variant 1 [Verruconis gallopava]
MDETNFQAKPQQPGRLQQTQGSATLWSVNSEMEQRKASLKDFAKAYWTFSPFPGRAVLGRSSESPVRHNTPDIPNELFSFEGLNGRSTVLDTYFEKPSGSPEPSAHCPWSPATTMFQDPLGKHSVSTSSPKLENTSSENGYEYVKLTRNKKEEIRVNSDGALLGGWKFRVPVFPILSRNHEDADCSNLTVDDLRYTRELYAVAYRCAKVLGYKNTFEFLRKYPALYRIVATAEEKEDLIDRGILRPFHRLRRVHLVTAKSVFRIFGHRIVRHGNPAEGGYWKPPDRTESISMGFSSSTSLSSEDEQYKRPRVQRTRNVPQTSVDFGEKLTELSVDKVPPVALPSNRPEAIIPQTRRNIPFTSLSDDFEVVPSPAEISARNPASMVQSQPSMDGAFATVFRSDDSLSGWERETLSADPSYNISGIQSPREDSVQDLGLSMSSCSIASYSIHSSSEDDVDTSFVNQLLREYLNDVLKQITSTCHGFAHIHNAKINSAHNEQGDEPSNPSRSYHKSQSCRGQKRSRSEYKQTAKTGTGFNSEENDDDENSGEDDDSRKRSKAPRALIRDRIPTLKLACPFYKRNPQRYQNCRPCRGPGWDTAHRVKEHIYRKHALPIHCRRCNAIFDTETSLTVHSKQEISCLPTVGIELEGFDKNQEKMLKAKKKLPHLSEAEKWIEIFKILFPHDDPDQIPSPYCDLTRSDFDHLEKFKDYVIQELPEKLQSILQCSGPDGDGPLNREDPLQRISTIVQQVAEEVLQSYSLRMNGAISAVLQKQNKSNASDNTTKDWEDDFACDGNSRTRDVLPETLGDIFDTSDSFYEGEFKTQMFGWFEIDTDTFLDGFSMANTPESGSIINHPAQSLDSAEIHGELTEDFLRTRLAKGIAQDRMYEKVTRGGHFPFPSLPLNIGA